MILQTLKPTLPDRLLHCALNINAKVGFYMNCSCVVNELKHHSCLP